jgi:hypothetical protein
MQEKPLRIPNTKKPTSIVANFKPIEYTMACSVYHQEQKRIAENLANQPKKLPAGML